MEEIKIGIYKHTKTGNLYTVIGIGTHTENKEKYVIYNSSDMKQGDFWIRPISIFKDIIEYNQKGQIPRFEYIGDE